MREFDDSSMEKLKEYKGIKIKYVPTIQAKGLAAMSSSFFAALRAAFGKYDVVHFHAAGPCAMLGLSKLFGKRCIATVHGAAVIIGTLKSSLFSSNRALNLSIGGAA